ncbi:hypothetical protein [Salmonella enterica]|uniref:hypothetical protein n=1 Tax=Salmonella enterica TaxID=28901 RepID=UPI0020CC367D|nr:hypothetical protein [Salmonella enterica]WGI49109.1 hypothetical protein QBX66_21585 [Salmonella enterica subsp. diarizonae serovar 48:i:z]
MYTMKPDTIAIYRRRIAIAALNRMKHSTGGCRLTISMPDGSIEFVDIDEASMLKLLQHFEKQARDEYGAETNEFLRQTYRNSLDINSRTEYLTETGKMIIDEIFTELIKHAKEKCVCGGGIN